MKIGMLLEAPFPPDLRVENEARVLAQQGHTVHIFSLTFDKTTKNEKIAQNIFVHRMKMNRSVFNKIRVSILRFPLYNFIWLRYLRRATSRINLDAIHVHDLPLAKVGSIISMETRIPFILDLHENYPAALIIWKHSQKMLGNYFLNYQKWLEYEEELVRKADRIIIVIEEAMQRFLERGIDKNKLTVVSNTSDLDILDAYHIPQNVKDQHYDFIITYVGGFGAHRGLKTAIMAMPKILKHISNAKLILVGEGSDRNELEMLVSEYGIQEKVIFTGWVPFHEIPEYIHQSDIGIIPHISSEHTESTIPHKLFQYMYLKKPVVASDCKPLKRIVTETGAGLVFKSGDSSDFALAIVKLREKAFRDELGMRGYHAVVQKYNWKNDGNKLIDLYNSLKNE